MKGEVVRRTEETDWMQIWCIPAVLPHCLPLLACCFFFHLWLPLALYPRSGQHACPHLFFQGLHERAVVITAISLPVPCCHILCLFSLALATLSMFIFPTLREPPSLRFSSARTKGGYGTVERWKGRKYREEIKTASTVYVPAHTTKGNAYQSENTHTHTRTHRRKKKE